MLKTSRIGPIIEGQLLSPEKYKILSREFRPLYESHSHPSGINVFLDADEVAVGLRASLFPDDAAAAVCYDVVDALRASVFYQDGKGSSGSIARDPAAKVYSSRGQNTKRYTAHHDAHTSRPSPLQEKPLAKKVF